MTLSRLPVPSSKLAGSTKAAGAELPTEVICPSCKKPGMARLRSRYAEDFCQCGFPLFWAADAASSSLDDRRSTEHLRRPGEKVVAHVEAPKPEGACRCPSCGLGNDTPLPWVENPSAPEPLPRCTRCHSELLPRSMGAVVVRRQLATRPSQAGAAPGRPDAWIVGVAAATVLALLVLAVVLLST